MLPRSKAVDGPSHHRKTLDVGDEHTSLTRMVTTTTFFPRPLVNTALVMRSRWKRWIKVVLVCHTLEVLHARKPRRSYPSTCCHHRRTVSRSSMFRSLSRRSSGSPSMMLNIWCVDTSHAERLDPAEVSSQAYSRTAD